jgi:hypothetical protein
MLRFASTPRLQPPGLKEQDGTFDELSYTALQ